MKKRQKTLLSMAKSKRIYHRNDARPAIAKMKLSTRRLLYLTIAQLEKGEDKQLIFEPDRLFVISAKVYAELCGVDESVAYKQLKEGIEDIRSFLIRMPESEVLGRKADDRKSGDRMVVFTVANYGVYSDGDGYVELKLDPIIAPYISNFSNNFTGQLLLSGLRLPDNNANRIYMLLREWIGEGKSIQKDILLSDLKDKLFLSDTKTYETYNNFNNFFFKRAVNKLTITTEFTKIEMEIIERQRRKAYKVRISYEYEGQEQDLKNSGFYVGQKEKEKQAREATAKQKKTKKAEHNPSLAKEAGGMKQINGRFHTQETARAAGYDWDDH